MFRRQVVVVQRCGDKPVDKRLHLPDQTSQHAHRIRSIATTQDDATRLETVERQHYYGSAKATKEISEIDDIVKNTWAQVDI